MSANLRVLLIESERGAADEAEAALDAAGHTVVRCREKGAPAFPCKGVAEGHHCPLDDGIVDVALDIRPRLRSQPAPQEDGVACALRRHVPVVVAGSSLLNPYDGYASAIVPTTANVVDVCEKTASAVLREHSRVAARALSACLDRREIQAVPLVAVRRRNGALLVTVTGASHASAETKSMASVRMSVALREVDRDARGIDVVFH
jgi:hypothetical protein